MKPTVSIIIPVYNKREYILQCINALLIQEYKSYEIILVDDGSTDGSSELLDEVVLKNRNESIHVYHQKNQGVSVARNRGLELAKGEWIWFVDADDIPNSTWLNEIKTHFEDGKYDIIFSDYTKSFPDRDEDVKTNIQDEVDTIDFPQVFMELQYQNGYFGYLWCKLLRKKFIEDNRVCFTPGLTLAEDLKFLVEIYKNAPKTFFSNANAYNYTVDAINSSKEKTIDYLAQLNIHYDIYQWVKGTASYIAYESELKKHISYYVAFVFFYGYENDCTLRQELEWWKQNPHYRACLDPSQLTGIMKFIVILLKYERIILLKIILRTRGMLRSLYRRIKRVKNRKDFWMRLPKEP